MRFSNVYDDRARSESYAALEFPGTYYLAFRDLPAIISENVQGRKAIDFGCGTGRSTRFLRNLGFEVVGVDISESMLAQARARDPEGVYQLVPNGDLSGLEANAYDLALAAFTFDNIPSLDLKVRLFQGLKRLLRPEGRIVNLVSAPEIYVNEWMSFSTRDFPENRNARAGDIVRIVMLDVQDRRPVEDVLMTGAAYQEAYDRAGVRVNQVHRPLGLKTEPYAWVSEASIAPWVIYVLGKAEKG